MKKQCIFFTAACILFGSSQLSFACPKPPYDIHTDSNYDFGDAPDSYEEQGEAYNLKGIWQKLGPKDGINGIDDGVVWSVDGGATYTNTSPLIIGQEVTFKITFWQGNNGIHSYDQLLAVLDSNQSGTFDETTDLTKYWKIDTDSDRRETPLDLSDALELYYYFTWTVPGTIEDGSSTWLRVRAHCNHTPKIGPNGYLSQGETEDYELKFTSAPVPEPATMLLFGTGLAGLAGIARRRVHR